MLTVAVESLWNIGAEIVQASSRNPDISGLYNKLLDLISKTDPSLFVDIAADAKSALLKDCRPQAKGVIAFYLMEKHMGLENLVERVSRIARKVYYENLRKPWKENSDYGNWFEAQKRVATGVYYFYIKYYSGVLKPHLDEEGINKFHRELKGLSGKLNAV